ncbi:uncharacterized protein LOC132726636 [Ruditapes philippinarum]|uniref:uncharacterized protein LOC132726636 n=1 Tax=Ruditapes philippinarum TaxID=129788 RepID=UPI00295C1DAA|nr:uncharacterized protein LOC132726636 [Ruditapes philippinarum]
MLEAEDLEGDVVVFELLDSESFPFGNISITENLFLHIALCFKCYGVTNIQVIVSDIPDSTDIPSSQSLANITIEVLHVNIPPNIALFSSERISLLYDDPTEHVMIYKDQDGEEITFIVGTFIAFELDESQNVTILSNTSGIGEFDLYYLSRETLLEYTGCTDFMCFEWDTTSPAVDMTWQAIVITFTLFNTTSTGIGELIMVAQDDNGTYSDVITVAVVIMENKCAHGTCKSKNPLEYTCDDIIRIDNFDQHYTCDCPIAWQGPYCEYDVDECSLGLCDKPKHCENTNGSFNCFCESSDIICLMSFEVWQFAMLVIGVAVVIAIIFIFLFRKKITQNCNRQNRVMQYEDENGDNLGNAQLLNERNEPARRMFDTSLLRQPIQIALMDDEDAPLPPIGFMNKMEKYEGERDHPSPADIEERSNLYKSLTGTTGPTTVDDSEEDTKQDNLGEDIKQLPSISEVVVEPVDSRPASSTIQSRMDRVLTISDITTTTSPWNLGED